MVRIAIGQIEISKDVRANGAAIRKQMAQAHEGSARLIHFPEGALSGYAKAQIKNWTDVDWSVIGEEMQYIADLARELRLWVVVGCAHRLTAPNLPYNSLYIINDNGGMHGRYDKRMISHGELKGWYTPGTEAIVFDVDGFRFGCAICIEFCFPELFAEYERLGVDCCLISTYSDLTTDAIVGQAHAYVNCFWVSMAVPAQCGRTLPSQIIDPNGVPTAVASRDAEPDLLAATLDRDDPGYEIALRRARPWRSLARVGGIYRGRHVDDPRSRDRSSW